MSQGARRDSGYTPVQPGIRRQWLSSVTYEEVRPDPSEEASVVSCYWRIRSREHLSQPFAYFVLPDGCVDVVFDLFADNASAGALVMTPYVKAVELDFGCAFDYAGIRFRPGAWSDRLSDVVGGALEINDIAGVDLVEVNRRLRSADADQVWTTLRALAGNLAQNGVIAPNDLIDRIIRSDAATVADIVRVTGYSQRQVQRTIRERAGFRPHDFIKVIRFQQSISADNRDAFADQSHYIREFKRIVGMTPGQFKDQFGDVASLSNHTQGA